MTANSGEPISIATERGDIRCIYHAGRTDGGAVVWVGGTDGGFDGPAEAIYPTLADDLLADGVGSLRLDFRLRQAPGDVDEGAHDVLAGIAYLQEKGAQRIGLVGHSYGGAVVITAAVLSQRRGKRIDAVVTLSTQTAGTTLTPELQAPLLLVHGELDWRLPPSCSRYVHSIAPAPKTLVILPGAKHSLRQRRDELRRLLNTWLVERLQG